MDLFSFTVLGCTLLGPLTIGEMGGKDELNMMEWPPYSSIFFAKDIPYLSLALFKQVCLN